MPINSVHPSYKKQTEDWETMRDALEGEAAIREKVRRYLPPPPGMNTHGSHDINDILGMAAKGIQSRYSHYATFAEWPEIVQMTANAIQGLIHEKPPTVELPGYLEYLIETATPSGDTLQELWEAMTREVFAAGRISLLAEIFNDETYICPYVAESLINWHVLPKMLGGGATLVVLKEVRSQPKADDKYEHEDIETYRELELFQPTNDAGEPIGDPVYRVRIWRGKEGDEPEIVRSDSTDGDGWIVPQFFGKQWDEIPLTVSNTRDRTFKFGPLPLIAAAKRAISIFRKTADYFRSLYNKGDPQAVLWGVEKDDVPSSIGGSQIWAFPDAEGKAEYLDIDGDGIPMQRDAIKDQYERFEIETGQLINGSDTEGVKSGEALRREAAGQQVSVKSVVINAGAALQAHLRTMARLMGKSDADIEAIVFQPNLDFAEPLMSGKDFADYVMAKTGGGPISMQTLHDLARRHKITDREFEEEMKLIEEEGPSAAEIEAELRAEMEAEQEESEGEAEEEDDDAEEEDGNEGA